MINYSIILRTANPLQYNAAQSRIKAAQAAGEQPSASDLAIKAEQKAYGIAQYSDTMDLNAFARHIATHGCVYSRADIAAILTMAVDCLREQLLNGTKVTLGDLGSFSVSLNCVGAKSADKFNVSSNVRKVNVNWERGHEFENLLDDAEFNLVASRAVQAKVKAALKADPTATIIDLTNPDIDPDGGDNGNGGSTPSGGNASDGGTNNQGSSNANGSINNGNTTNGGTTNNGDTITPPTTAEGISITSIGGQPNGGSVEMDSNGGLSIVGTGLRKLTSANFINSEGKVGNYGTFSDTRAVISYSDGNLIEEVDQTLKVVVAGETLFTLNVRGNGAYNFD